MVRRGASLDANQAWWQLLEERQDRAALQPSADDHLAGGINSVDLEDRLRDVETLIKIKAARYGFPECSDGGGTPELEGNSGVNRGEAQLRANFEACKLQANSALQRCTVTPRPSNCALATTSRPGF